MHSDKLLLELLEVFAGIFVSTAISAPVKESSGCRGSWQYVQLQNGWGCVRPLTSKFSDRACLTRGFHLALDQRYGKRTDLLCIKNEADRDCRPDHDSTWNVDKDHDNTSTQTSTASHIDQSDKKEGIEQEDKKSELARSLGCCMPGLSPLSPAG